MGRADIDAPTLEAEERLVEQNEAEIMPQKPELPVTLDAALDTFIEKLNLEQPGPAEFVLGSALAATAERFGPSEAEVLLSRFDEDLTAEFFENLIDSGEIPQSPTMNNLLAGDVNSQAAQFILENLAAQSASGAFITMQANIRNSEPEREKREERSRAFSTAVDLINGINSITRSGLFNFENASTDAERQQVYEQMVQDMYQLWLEDNPNATEEQKEYMREHFEKFTQSEIVSKYAQQLANGEITVEQYNEKIRTLRDEFEKHPQLQEYVLELDEINEDLSETQRLLANAQALVANGGHDAHLVTHYQAQIDQLRQAQADKVREMEEYRQSLEGELSDLSLEALNARIAAEQAELDELQALYASLNDLTGETAQLEAEMAEYQADVSAAQADHQFAETKVAVDEIGLGLSLNDVKDAARDLREAGFATISLKHFGDVVTPDGIEAKGLFDLDIKFSATLEDAVDYVVHKDESGQLYVNLHNGTRYDIPEWMERHIETKGAEGLEGARFDTASASELFTSHADAISSYHSERSELEASVAEEVTMRVRLESLLSLADSKLAQVDQLQDRITEMETTIETLPDGEAKTDLLNQVVELKARMTGINEVTENINQIKTSLGGVSQFGLSDSLDNASDFSLLNTGSSYSSLAGLGVGTSALSGGLGLNDPLTFNNNTLGTTDPFNLGYNFDLPSWELNPSTFNFMNDDFLTSLSYAESYLMDLDFSPITTELDSLEADINEVVNSVLAEETLPEGIDRAALEDAVRKDIEWSTENQACRAPEGTNVAAVLGSASVQGIAESFDGTGPMGLPNMSKLFNGMAEFSENAQLAMRISQAVDQAAVDGRGQKLVDAQKRLQEIEGGEQNTDAVADAAAESLTLEAPSVEEMTRDAKLANEARVYADQVRANGVVTERDLEDAFPGLSAEEMDLVKAEMDAEGIEVRLEEPVNDIEAPAPTVSEPSASVTNTRSPYEPAAMTPGV